MHQKNKKKSAPLSNPIAYPLREYIAIYYGGNQRELARHIDVQPAQITQWLEKDFIVVDHVLFSPRRNLKE